MSRTDFFKALDSFFSWTTYLASRKPSPRLTAIAHPELEAFVAQHGFLAARRPLVGWVTTEEEDICVTEQLLERLPLLISDPQLLQMAHGEILAKVLAYRDLKVGRKISQYTVDHVFDLGGQMPAFGLISSTGSAPVLLYRGTDLDIRHERSRASLKSDLDLKGPGYSTYHKARSDIREWLKGKNARAIGCSLGGVLATYTALFDGDLLSAVEPSLAYNPPGVFKKNLKLWNSLSPKPPLITYTLREDLISKVGHLIGDVREFSVPRKIGPIATHSMLMFAEG